MPPRKSTIAARLTRLERMLRGLLLELGTKTKTTPKPEGQMNAQVNAVVLRRAIL